MSFCVLIHYFRGKMTQISTFLSYSYLLNIEKSFLKSTVYIRLSLLFLTLCLIGFPQSAQSGVGLSSSLNSWNEKPRVNGLYPTVDYRALGFHWQLNLLDTIESLTKEDRLLLAGSGSYLFYEESVSELIRGVGYLGAGTGFFQNEKEEVLEIWLSAAPKMGLELGDTVGMGLYLAPQIGVVRTMNDSLQHIFLVGGGIQISVWSEKWP